MVWVDEDDDDDDAFVGCMVAMIGIIIRSIGRLDIRKSENHGMLDFVGYVG